MKHYYDTVFQTISGGLTAPVNGATVNVYLQGTLTLATIYGDDGLTTKNNPTLTNASGQFDFYIANGRYDLSFSGSGLGTVTQRNVEITDSMDLVATGKTPIAFTANNTHSGTEAFTGSILAKNLEGVLYIDPTNTASWGTAANCTTDVGVCLAAAYSALPSTGGRIRVAASSTNYNMLTAFTASVAGKPVLIEGDPGGSVILNWTPTTGTMFTFDTKLGPNQHPVGMGMRDCVLTSSGPVSSTAIALGSTNSGEGYEFQRVKIDTFTTGVSITAGGAMLSFANRFDSVVFRNLTNGIVGQSGYELGKVFGGSFFNVGTGISGGGDWAVVGTSCDDPGAGGCVGNGVVVNWIGGHFENPGLGIPSYVNSNGVVNIYGGVALDDVTTGTNTTSWFINTGTDAMVLDGIELFSGGRAMATNPVITWGANAHGALRVYNKSSALLTPLYPANALIFNQITDLSFNNTGVNVAAFQAWKVGEDAGTLPLGVVNQDICYGDSVAHGIKCSFNNSIFESLLGPPSTGTLFASLGAPANGTIRYCPDCTIANPCAGSGTGALAKRLNAVWVCN